MEKEESIEKNTKEDQTEIEGSNSEKTEDIKDVEEKTEEKLTPEEELLNIKDKLARTFAEMENQRRRYEKEKKLERRKNLCKVYLCIDNFWS